MTEPAGKVFADASVPRDTGEDKRLDLQEAVARLVKPEQTVQIDRHAAAAMRAIIRRFRGSSPRLTIVLPALTGLAINMVQQGLVERAVTGIVTFTHPATGPVPVVQKAYQEGRVALEFWTSLTLQLRLMAGALDLPFLPARSLAGSSLAAALPDGYAVVRDPFSGADGVGVVRSLKPDLSIVHGCIADRYGNTVLPPPLEDTFWGPRASSGGVLVTVEKIVAPEQIRRHPSLVKIPGYLVAAVSEVPFGAHPLGLVHHELPGFEGCAADIDFLIAHRESCKTDEAAEEWAREWIYAPDSHGSYLATLGDARLRSLRASAAPAAWPNIDAGKRAATPTPPLTVEERMIVLASRAIAERVRSQGYRTMLVGFGPASLAASLARLSLQEKGVHIDLMAGNGVFGYEPRPGGSLPGSPPDIAGATMFTDTVDLIGAMATGSKSSCLSVLGTVQVDRFGNLNTSRIDGALVLGSGAANDLAVSSEVIVLSRLDKSRFADHVEFVTTPGDRVTTVVSDFAVFEKPEGEEELVLAGYLAGANSDEPADVIESIRAACGWDLRVSPGLREYAAPSGEELSALRELDPEGIFRGGRRPAQGQEASG